ncbi:MAG: ribosome-associated translation inhibitor RaiA [Thermodesulfovibrionales bacterium]|nr:ribosome-associated translation inhibitor RaiA [Thermodesulfovibrionales bacterium]
MNIIVNGRHLEITEALRNYAVEKIGKFEKFLSNINEAVVTLSVEKYRHKAEVLLKVDGVMIQAEGTTGEVYSAIDGVVEKLEKQVLRHKEKMQSHRKGDKRSPIHKSEVYEEERGRIIKHKKFDMKPMSPEEAVHHMELLDKDFFVFVNDKTDELNVVYRRKDGNYGLIEKSK